jgi:flagellar motor switch protein FliN/FliY
MSELLSNDQLDALLSQGAMDSSGSLPGGGESNDAEPVKSYQALGSALEIFCGQAKSVLHTVLNKDIAFSVTSCQKGDAALAGQKITGPILGVKVPFKTGLSGSMYVVLQKKDAAILSDLMMMGDGSAPYVDDHKDAIGELVSQIMGSYAVALGPRCGTSVGAGQSEVQEFGFGNAPFKIESWDMAICRMAVAGFSESWAAIFLDEELSGQFASKFKAPEPETAEDSTGAMIESDNVGLSTAEIDDLAKVSSKDDMSMGGGGFRESSMESIADKVPRENIDALLDVELDVSIELGKANLSIKKILELAPGSIVELDKMAGEPVDLLVNSKVVAKGEVVVVDENFGIRIVSLVSAEERIRSLR